LIPLKKTLYILVVAALIASTILHMPVEVQQIVFGKTVIGEPLYADLLRSTYIPLFRDSCRQSSVVEYYWLDRERGRDFCGGAEFYPLPFKDYKLLLTPVETSLWVALTLATYVLTPKTSGQHALASDQGLAVFYTLYSLVTGIAIILSFAYIYRTLEVLEAERRAIILATTVSATLVTYAIYDWFPVAMLFYSMYLYYFIKHEYSKACLALGLLASTNPLGLVLVFLTLYNTLTRRFPLTGKNLAILGLSCLVPYAALTAVYPSLFLDLINRITSSVCNNCIYLFLTNNASSQILRGVGVIVWALAITVYLAWTPNISDRRSTYAYTVLFQTLAIALSLEPVPQALLLVIPFLPALYTIYDNYRPLLPHYVMDLCNSLIILLWFKDYSIRRELSFLGIALEQNPLTLESPVQWIAQLRNTVLIVLTAITILTYTSLKNNTKQQL